MFRLLLLWLEDMVLGKLEGREDVVAVTTDGALGACVAVKIMSRLRRESEEVRKTNFPVKFPSLLTVTVLVMNKFYSFSQIRL